MTAEIPYPATEEVRARMRANLAAFEARPARAPGMRRAAVAAAVVADGRGAASFVLTERAQGLREHAGQYALPGGRLDGAETPEAAALRELAEEVGLRLPPSAVLGRLDDYPTRSGYVITPVVVWGGTVADLVANPTEVAAVHVFPLEVLDAPGVPRLLRIPESDRPVIQIPLWADDGVYAPTGAVLYQLREVALHGRPTRVAHFEQPVFAWR